MSALRNVLAGIVGDKSGAARSRVADLEARVGKRREAIAACDEQERSALADVVTLDHADELAMIPGKRAALVAEEGALVKALDAARAALAAIENEGRLGAIEAAATTTGSEWLKARGSVVSAAVALAEARGKEADLEARFARLVEAASTFGGTVAYPDVPRRLHEEIADRIYAKHGEAARAFRFDLELEHRSFLMTVGGLAGPEPDVLSGGAK